MDSPIFCPNVLFTRPEYPRCQRSRPAPSRPRSQRQPVRASTVQRVLEQPSGVAFVTATSTRGSNNWPHEGHRVVLFGLAAVSDSGSGHAAASSRIRPCWRGKLHANTKEPHGRRIMDRRYEFGGARPLNLRRVAGLTSRGAENENLVTHARYRDVATCCRCEEPRQGGERRFHEERKYPRRRPPSAWLPPWPVSSTAALLSGLHFEERERVATAGACDDSRPAILVTSPALRRHAPPARGQLQVARRPGAGPRAERKTGGRRRRTATHDEQFLGAARGQ